MNYAFMTFSCPSYTLAQALDAAKQYGYAGVEPRVESKHAHGVELTAAPEQRRNIKRQFEDAGIAACCVATSCKYANPVTTDDQVETTRRYVDLAADIGAPRLRVFGGDVPDTVSRAQAIEIVAGALVKTGEHAKSRGVTLCLETHDAWTNPQHVARVMQQANHPNVAVNWDFMHPLRASGWTVEKGFGVLRPWIKHVHCHDGLLRLDRIELRPIGTGQIDHIAALRLLKQADYDGFVSGEWINWEPPEVHLPREVAAMKAIERGL
jgi:sugar phosphate isomerase/epimerase